MEGGLGEIPSLVGATVSLWDQEGAAREEGDVRNVFAQEGRGFPAPGCL